MRTIITRPNNTGMVAVVLLKRRFTNVDWRVIYTNNPTEYSHLLDPFSTSVSDVIYFIGWEIPELPIRLITDRATDDISIYIVGKGKKLENLLVRLVPNSDKNKKFKDYVRCSKKEDPLVNLLFKEASSTLKEGL